MSATETGRPGVTLSAVLLAAGLFAITLLTASRSTLWDRDEARFGAAAAEMAAARQFLYPTFNGDLRADKPILPYWLMSASITLAGKTELSLRIWSAIAAAGTGLAAGVIASSLFSASAGVWTIAILATSPLFMIEAGAATADSLLLLFLTLAMLVVARSLRVPLRARELTLLAGSLALGLLAKGPVALAIPILAAALMLALRPPALESPRRLVSALALASIVAALIFLAWFLPADHASAGRLWSEGFGRHVVGRALRPMEGHGGARLFGLPYYMAVIAIGFSPWTLFLPGTLSAAAGGRIGGRKARVFLAVSILSPLLLFSVVATRLPHYLLPAFPALAIAVAATLDAEHLGNLVPRDVRWLRRGVWLFGPVAAGESVCLAAGFWVLPLQFRWPALLLGATIAGFSAAAITLQLTSRFRGAAAMVFAGVVAAQVAAVLIALPVVEREKPIPAIARDVRTRFPGTGPVATLGFAEPSFDFYLGRPPVERLAGASDLARWAARPGPGVLVTTRAALAACPRPGSLGLSTVAARDGFNYSKGQWIELLALERHASHP